METIVNYFEKYTIVDLFAAITMIIVCVRGIENGIKWATKKLSAYYKYKKGIEEEEDLLKTHTKEIKSLTEKIDLLVDKIEKQQSRLENFEQEGKSRDCAILRDCISGGMRYFSQKQDENGVVHISITDHENMEDLFQEYFKAGGNGTYRQMYENEFKKYIINK